MTDRELLIRIGMFYERCAPQYEPRQDVAPPEGDFLGMKRKMDAVYCAPRREPSPPTESSKEISPFLNLL